MAKEIYKFATDGRIYNLVDSSLKTVWPLPTAVYNLQESRSGFYLEYVQDKFEFNFKRYGLDEDFIGHVLKRYPTMKKSIGILLNGTKGAGKSVIAKTLSNELGLPVIIIAHPFQDLPDFISKIKFPCIFFMDEFEKVFKNEEGKDISENMLSVMDGVYSGDVAHVFILTTNSLTINENFISRPGRILYSRTYKSLDLEVVENFLNENLVDKTKEAELIQEINSLDIVTIDILKSIVEEINTTGIDPKKALEYLNIEKASRFYPCHRNSFGREEMSLAQNYNIDKFEDDIKFYEDCEEKIDNDEELSDDDKKRYNELDICLDFNVRISKSIKDLKEKEDYFDGNLIAKILNNGKYIITVNKTYGTVYWYKINTLDLNSRYPMMYDYML